MLRASLLQAVLGSQSGCTGWKICSVWAALFWNDSFAQSRAGFSILLREWWVLSSLILQIIYIGWKWDIWQSSWNQSEHSRNEWAFQKWVKSSRSGWAIQKWVGTPGVGRGKSISSGATERVGRGLGFFRAIWPSQKNSGPQQEDTVVEAQLREERCLTLEKDTGQFREIG